MRIRVRLPPVSFPIWDLSVGLGPFLKNDIYRNSKNKRSKRLKVPPLFLISLDISLAWLRSEYFKFAVRSISSEFFVLNAFHSCNFDELFLAVTYLKQ